MLYPQNGSIANGSRRSSPTVPSAAAVFSEATLAPRNTPWSQPNDSITSGTVLARLPPNKIAEIGTPAGSSHSGAMIGHWLAGVVNRALGCAAGSAEPGAQSRPFQSVRCAGGWSVRPSHHTSPSSVKATLVKMLLPHMAATALALVFRPVPGATPKNPASGLMAYGRPSEPNLIQQMSSPMVSAFQPLIVGWIMARFVLPHAEGKAPAMYLGSPDGGVSLRISMCSASQPSSRAMTDAIRSA